MSDQSEQAAEVAPQPAEEPPLEIPPKVEEQMLNIQTVMAQYCHLKKKAFVAKAVVYKNLIETQEYIKLYVPSTGKYAELYEYGVKPLSKFAELISSSREEVRSFIFDKNFASMIRTGFKKIKNQGRVLPTDSDELMIYLMKQGATTATRFKSFCMSEQEKEEHMRKNREEYEEKSKRKANSAEQLVDLMARQETREPGPERTPEEGEEGGGGGGEEGGGVAPRQKLPRTNSNVSDVSKASSSGLSAVMAQAGISAPVEGAPPLQLTDEHQDEIQRLKVENEQLSADNELLLAQVARRNQNIKLLQQELKKERDRQMKPPGWLESDQGSESESEGGAAVQGL